MDYDIGPILSKWKHKPGEVAVRCIAGRDGRPKIQMRLDLGLLQMEQDGRPDGRRPHGCEYSDTGCVYSSYGGGENGKRGEGSKRKILQQQR